MVESDDPEASHPRLDKLYIEAITARFSKIVEDKLESFRKETQSIHSTAKDPGGSEHDGNNNRGNNIRPPPSENEREHLSQEDEATDYYGSDRSMQTYHMRRHVRQEAAPQQNNPSHGLKLKIPPFYGKSDPDAYLEWEKKIELVFDCQHYTEESKVRYAATEFYEYALSWWDQLVTTRRKNRELPIRSWRKMKQLLRKRFVPSHYHRELHTRLRNLNQGTRTVDEYYQELETLMLRADIQESNEATMSRFLGGLNRDLIDLLEVCDYVDIEELLHKAVMYEKQLKRKSTRSNYNSNRTGYAKDSRTEPKETSKPTTTHSDFKNRTEASTTSARAREIVCFKCQGRGHISSACPNKRVMILTKDGGYESADEEELPESPKSYEECAVRGDLLMIKKVLHVQEQTPNIPAKTAVEAQRENLFQTRCLVKDKVCSFIIDGGSCTNVASEYMVNKLGLKVMKHPKPYNLHWLNDRGEMRVNNQVLVPFSIGKYEDEVLCDVLPMEAGHILVGRPWQYDRRVVHDGSTNKYSFEFKGRKVTLVPLTPSEIYQDQKKKGKQPMSNPYKQSNFLAKFGSNDNSRGLLLLSQPSPFEPEKVNYLQQMRAEQGQRLLVEKDELQESPKPMEKDNQGCIQFGQIEFTFTWQKTAKEFAFTNAHYIIKELHHDQTTTESGKFSQHNTHFKSNGRGSWLFKAAGYDSLHITSNESNKAQSGPQVGKEIAKTPQVVELNHSGSTKAKGHMLNTTPIHVTSKDGATSLQDDSDLRSNPFQEGGDDMIMDKQQATEHEGIMELGPEGVQQALELPNGPITRAKARLLEQAVGTLLIQAESNLSPVANQTTLVMIQAD